MSWNILTYAFGTEKYLTCQKFLTEHAAQFGVNHIAFTEEDLHNTDFYKNNKEFFETSVLMSEENKFGHSVWKAQIVLMAMEQLEEGDKIFYLDAMDMFHPEVFAEADELMGDDPCLLVMGGTRNGDYTKRDCFHFMDCDEEDYWESNQLESGLCFWRVCDEAKAILNEWEKWLLDERVNGLPTTYSGKPELDGFREVRRDQSILTNMAVRDGLPVAGEPFRNFVECNTEYWYERDNKGLIPSYRLIDVYLRQIKSKYPIQKV